LPTPLLVGNDIVDLGLPQTRHKALDARFIERVFAPEERAVLSASCTPERTLWCLWSAKEAAYKVVKKRYPATLFSHKKFVVTGTSAPTPEPFEGCVSYEQVDVAVRWHLNEAYVHCVGVWPPGAAVEAVDAGVRRSDDAQLARFTLSERERRSARLPASQSARQLAKQLLARRGLETVEIVRPRAEGRLLAPRLWQRGRRLEGSDVSLSHHGRFVAAVIVTTLPPTALQTRAPSA